MTSVDTNETLTGPTPAQQMRKRALSHFGFMIGGGLLLLIILAAIFAPLLTTQDPYAQDLSQRFLRPAFMDDGTWEHPLGTDHLGRDYLARLLFGARISLTIGLVTTLISGVIGTVLGVAADAPASH